MAAAVAAAAARERRARGGGGGGGGGDGGCGRRWSRMRPAARVRRAWVVLAAAVEQGRFLARCGVLAVLGSALVLSPVVVVLVSRRLFDRRSVQSERAARLHRDGGCARDAAGGARASCVGGSRRRSRAGPFSRAVVSLPFLVLLSPCPSLRVRRSLAPPARGGARAHHERARGPSPSATRRARCAASPRGVLFPLSLFAVCVPGVFLGLALLPCCASSARHRPHRRSLRLSRRCSRSARAARPPPLAP